MTAIFVADMFVAFRLAYRENGDMIVDRSVIATEYMRYVVPDPLQRKQRWEPCTNAT